jgi:hypothetical protein
MATRKLTTHHATAQRRAFGYARVSTDSEADSGIRDALREHGHRVPHQTVSNILARGEAALAPIEGAA